MSTQDEINAENALRHARADTDSSRAELQRLARVIAEERDKAQVVLSQKGVLEVINADLLAALKGIQERARQCRTGEAAVGSDSYNLFQIEQESGAAIAKAEEA